MARNGQSGWLAKSAGVRMNLHEYAGAGAIRQEKTPTENGWGFNIGGGGGNRTPVRKPSTGSSTYLVRLFDFARITPTEQAEFTLVALSLVSVQATRTDTSLCE